MEKYGTGTTFSRNCPQCNHQVDGLETSGCHFTENGGMKIYCEDDTFECPKCFFKERNGQNVREGNDKNF